MRKILRYSSLEWDEKQWEKQITWGDPDFPTWRGQKKDHQDREYPRAIEDNHVMFALLSISAPAKILLTPIENEGEPREITMNKGGLILVGNGFVYFDTRLAALKIIPSSSFICQSSILILASSCSAVIGLRYESFPTVYLQIYS